MPLPRSVVRYAAGTDTRAQFTTPPDPRQVDDLMDAFEDKNDGGQQERSAEFSTTWTHTSNGNNVAVPVTSGAMVWDDGVWDTSNDRWGPAPTDWFDEWTYVCLDIPWTVLFPDSAGGAKARAVEFRVKNSGGTVLRTIQTYCSYLDSAGFNVVSSGTLSLRIATCNTIEMRIFQWTGGNLAGIEFRWGPRIVGGTD